ncbi:MAG: mannonate dehydratase [Paenibacillus dendritiformis]|uniref:mannonate dehydratase n=1 Tax=uncultured Paenibacillus sp. TaxID=227322 RepID=UPI0025D93D50|nr:mannonate dehydratase [uncultured Paenibacillus sp.]MDU5142717.1 mannonate dehydratase [Paenibacillus dendritiformis]
MELTFRWYGADDPVRLDYIRQIPGMRGIVSAVYDVPVGESWSRERIRGLKETVEAHGLRLAVIESVPVHEDIKLGLAGRDRYIDNYVATLRNLAAEGIRTVCYNVMPVFDWTRSKLDHVLPDGSTTLIYEDDVIQQMDPASGTLRLPGWDTSYLDGEAGRLFERYRSIGEEQYWENIAYFVQRVMPEAAELGIRMAVHPDDPPWPIFGLPRILGREEQFARYLSLFDHPAHGMCFCTGSLGSDSANDLPQMIRQFGSMGRIHFVHARNVRVTGCRSFQETAHLSSSGSVDMTAVMRALADIGYTGPLRSDHGRMIWGEQGRPGYGLYDRALGAVYLNGIWEAVTKCSEASRASHSAK